MQKQTGFEAVAALDCVLSGMDSCCGCSEHILPAEAGRRVTRAGEDTPSGRIWCRN